MKTNLLLSAFGICTLLSFGQVVPNKDFVTFLPPIPGTKEQLDNVPSALDLTNNAVYISGYFKNTLTQRDYVLIKYDLNGAVVWQRTFDYAGLNDRALAITVDNAGNIYITGEATSPGNGTDIVTRKYDTNGNLMWSAVKNGSANADDKGLGITVDNSGDVYVCGYTSNTGTFKDFTVIRYNSSGIEQYSYTKNGTGNGDDVANAIVSFGNKLYVTGNVFNSIGKTNIYTTRLNSNNANVNWSKTEDGTLNDNDQGLDIKVMGNDVLICGGIVNVGTNQDYFFAKYNASNGNTVFTKTYDAFGGNDFATSLVLDASNTYAIVGLAQNGSNYDYHTTKYNNFGVFSWVNKHPINSNFVNVYPKIAVDAIVNHFYVSGVKFNSSLDAGIYQITPGGNESWADYHDGAVGLRDGFVDLAVDNIGRIYLATQTEVSPNSFEIALIRYSQTPVYFPIDNLNEKSNTQYLFYENKGQILKQGGGQERGISHIIMDAYPFTYISSNRISYKLVNKDTMGLDTIQRIDLNFVGSNPNAKAFSFEHDAGYLNIFDDSFTSDVTDIRGFKRAMVPNVYPGIDLHYYSNQNGLKLYYVIKPFSEASPNDIKLLISGANNVAISGAKLEIEGFNYKVIYDQPNVYQINSSFNVVPLSSATWTNIGVNTYAISSPTYNSALPLVIELDYGNSVSTTAFPIGNIEHLTYYGGSLDEGFRIVKVDQNNGFYVAVGSTRSYDAGKEFPTVPGSNVSTSVPSSVASNYLTTVLFDSLGVRKSANIYGVSGENMSPIGAEIKGNWITVIGNTFASSLPLYNSSISNLSPLTYSHPSGPGYVIQFEYDQITKSMNKIKWRTFLNGYANGISMRPNTKEIYITGSNTGSSYTGDYLYQAGAMNLTSLSGGQWQHQIFKFDSSGVRKWCSQIADFNLNANTFSALNEFNPQLPIFSSNTNEEYLNQCKIDCDNFGCVVVGEATAGFFGYSKYGAPFTSTVGGANDAFIIRLNKLDTITYSSFIGGGLQDEFTDVKITGGNEITAVGYSTSSEYKNLTYIAPSSSAYIDSTPPSIKAKVLINKFDSIGNRLWGTYFGNGNNQAVARSITVDNAGQVFITGNTTTNGLSYPVINSPNVYSETAAMGTEDGFMIGFDSTEKVIWNTLIGGTFVDAGLSLDWNPKFDRLMIAGITNTESKPGNIISKYFPTASASSTPPYASSGIWYNNAVNSSNGPASFYFGPCDGYIGWFKVKNLVGIEEYQRDKNYSEIFNLFPNPATSTVYLVFQNNLSTQAHIEIYNQLGQLVFSESKNNISKYNSIELNTSNFADGVYFVNVRTNNILSSKKLIVTH